MVCRPPSTLLTVTHMFTVPRKWSVTSKGIMSFTQRLKVAEPLIYVGEKKLVTESCYFWSFEVMLDSDEKTSLNKLVNAG